MVELLAASNDVLRAQNLAKTLELFDASITLAPDGTFETTGVDILGWARGGASSGTWTESGSTVTLHGSTYTLDGQRSVQSVLMRQDGRLISQGKFSSSRFGDERVVFTFQRRR
jgi:hypothetical protein